jgi:hypothetical protein
VESLADELAEPTQFCKLLLSGKVRCYAQLIAAAGSAGGITDSDQHAQLGGTTNTDQQVAGGSSLAGSTLCVSATCRGVRFPLQLMLQATTDCRRHAYGPCIPVIAGG